MLTTGECESHCRDFGKWLLYLGGLKSPTLPMQIRAGWHHRGEKGRSAMSQDSRQDQAFLSSRLLSSSAPPPPSLARVAPWMFCRRQRVYRLCLSLSAARQPALKWPPAAGFKCLCHSMAVLYCPVLYRHSTWAPVVPHLTRSGPASAGRSQRQDPSRSRARKSTAQGGGGNVELGTFSSTVWPDNGFAWSSRARPRLYRFLGG